MTIMHFIRFVDCRLYYWPLWALGRARGTTDQTLYTHRVKASNRLADQQQQSSGMQQYDVVHTPCRIQACSCVQKFNANSLHSVSLLCVETGDG